MSATLAQWHEEHVNFAKLLDFLEAQLDLFHDGDTPHYELMLDIMFYMTHYPDVIHHPKEDLAFARMKSREPRLAAVIEELDRQHIDLHGMGGELVARLSDVVNGTITSRESVETLARDYIATFRHHMNFEENRVLPMAARMLTSGDWAAIDAEITHVDDPLFGENPEPRYATIEQQLEQQARA
jgi:hemerythrin-like domain-containing protein